MPSLQQLEEFNSSFRDIGGEALSMSNNHLPMEEIEFPENEPPTPFPEGLADGPDLSPGLLNPDDLGLDIPNSADLLGESFPDPADPIGPLDPAGPLDPVGPVDPGEGLADGPDFNFGDLLGADISGEPAMDDLLGDFDMPDMPDMPEESAEPVSGIPEPPDSTTVESPAESEFANIEFPDIDLTKAVDLGGEIRDSAAQGDDDSKLDTPADLPDPLDPLGEGSPLDMAELGDLAADSGMDVLDDLDNADFGADTPADDLALPADLADPLGEGLDIGETPSDGEFAANLDLPDFDGADMNFDTGADANFDTGTDSSPNADLPGGDFGEQASLDLGGESLDLDGDFGGLADETADSGMDAADFGTDAADFETAPAADEFTDMPDIDAPADTGDAFDAFSLGGEEWKAPETLDTPDFSAPPEEADFGDFSLAGFDDTGPGKTGIPGTGMPVPEDIEEIHLSENDYKQLQETLSSYPLNLRIACEELIAEQAVAPDLMSALIKLLVRGAPAKETAALAGKILGRPIPIPKGYAKKTGAELEAEQASLGYIFVHRFLPVLRLVGAIALAAASLFYLTWRFVVVPLQAESIYKKGYTMLQAGEYTQANDQFRRAFEKHRVKNWFYRYAEGFRDERQYIYAERKYDELLRIYPRDKKGALDYASMETNYLKNYEKADRIIRNNILDYAVDDKEGLLALAENNLAWGETDPSRYEEARFAYARLMEVYGRKDPYLEGMLKYFIRTDQLAEVLPLQAHFMSNPKKRKITVPTLAELGGYLLDKRFEETEGVPEEYADEIEGIRDVLERAIKADNSYPESYYHLARYYNRYGSTSEERQTLRDALRTFAAAGEETPRRAFYRVDAHRRYAEVLINAKEFFPAEEELIRGVRLYEDARARQVLKTNPAFGRLYADLGDLEFFVKNGDMTAALRFYEEGERNGWAPPEIQYRMGTAHYQLEQWEEALRRFFLLSSAMPNNKRLLYALGNVSYLRGNYFAAQGYYNRLMDILSTERIRFPNLTPGSRPEEQELAERIMVADNNLGVTLEALTRVSGDTSYRARALGLFSESIRAWDVLTRNPESMARMRPIKDLYGPGINLAYINAQSIMNASPNYEPQIFMRIDKEALEPSPWETLVPRDYQLSDQLLQER
ncbi:hypothetical protein AGMMS50230_03520 [Spirochaetia bacterium]|nr:hypothetical protein AGMMS50230_03520 [Spirochaetia bacterium]